MANEYSEERRIKLPAEIIHQSSLLAANILSWEVTSENPSVILAKMAKQWNSHGNSLIILIRNDGRVQITSNCSQWQLNGKSVNKKHVENFYNTIERASKLLIAQNQFIESDTDEQIAESNDSYNNTGRTTISIKSVLINELSNLVDTSDLINLTESELKEVKQFLPLLKFGDVIAYQTSEKKIVKLSEEEWKTIVLNNRDIFGSFSTGYDVIYQDIETVETIRLFKELCKLIDQDILNDLSNLHLIQINQLINDFGKGECIVLENGEVNRMNKEQYRSLGLEAKRKCQIIYE